LRERSNDGKGMDWDEDEYKEWGEVTDDDIAFANKVLGQFLREEEEFAKYLANDKNWEHVGDNEEDEEMEHDWVKPDNAPIGVAGKPGGCGCGCSGKGNCGSPKSVEDSLKELEAKVGRVLNSRNVEKISQAISLLSDVIGADAPSMQQKEDGSVFVSAQTADLFDLRETLEPVVDYYHLDAEVVEDGVHLSGDLVSAAEKALDSAVGAFFEIKIKTAFDAGCRKFDGAILGFGGCPFANNEMVGNIPTEDLLRFFKRGTDQQILALQTSFQNMIA
jgi:hypothetical protein